MRAIVVGASSGLGRCIAIGRRGAKLAVMARRRERLVGTAKEIGPRRPRHSLWALARFREVELVGEPIGSARARLREI